MPCWWMSSKPSAAMKHRTLMWPGSTTTFVQMYSVKCPRFSSKIWATFSCSTQSTSRLRQISCTGSRRWQTGRLKTLARFFTREASCSRRFFSSWRARSSSLSTTIHQTKTANCRSSPITRAKKAISSAWKILSIAYRSKGDTTWPTMSRSSPKFRPRAGATAGSRQDAAKGVKIPANS